MKTYMIAITVLFIAHFSDAQVAINTDKSASNASAILDIKSTTKGLLIPRMTTAQRTAIATPAKGLIVFDITDNNYWFYNGTAWNALSTGSSSNYWTMNGSNIYSNNTGNVGIGLTAPLAPLHIKNNNEALRLQGTTPYISFYDNAGTYKGYIQSYNTNLELGTSPENSTGAMQFFLGSNRIMTLMPYGSMFLGGSTFANNDFSITRGNNSLGLSVFSNNSQFIASNNIILSPAFGSGNVGINTAGPSNKLQIGSMGATGFATNDFAIGNGTNAMAIQQTNASTLLGSTTDIILRPRNNGTGNVGINTLTDPANKLQIGSMGNTFFAGNDLAIGNGTAAMAIYQSNTATLIGSSTDIILKPRNNGFGRVGINTNTPRAPLDVVSGSDLTDIYYTYSYFHATNSGSYNGNSSDNPIPDVSIAASGRVYASEFDAFSDKRIKDVIGISNAAKDLQTINALQIADYTLKDKIKNGNRQYKKVIAQQVEKVYPQVVSRHADFIPNVYQLASNVEKTANGYLLTFTGKHNISKAAKKLQVLSAGQSFMQQFEIIGIPSETQVLINADEIKGDKVFVYGEEVDDFRTVDYEGLTTLNISATQEIDRQLQKEKAVNKAQEKRIEALEASILLLTNKSSLKSKAD